MALLFIDGFDHYTAVADMLTKWSGAGSGGGVAIGSYGRFSSGGARFSDQKYVYLTFPAGSTFVVGFVIRVTNVGGTGTAARIASFVDGTSNQIELRLNSDGTLAITRNGTALTGGVSTYVLPTATFVHLEWKVTIGSSVAASSNVLKASGATIISVAAGQNTQATANATVSTFRMGTPDSGANGFTVDYDDLFLLDNTGSANNDFIGDMRVQTLYPSAAGTHTSFSYSGGASNWQSVKEHAEDGDTTYVYSAAAGSIDTYQLDDLSSTPAAIAGVQVLAFVREDDAGPHTVSPALRSGSTDAFGTAVGVLSSYGYCRSLYETDPNTSATWTATAVNALEAGLKLVT